MGSEVRIVGRAALIINECQRGVVGPGDCIFPALAGQVTERGILPRIAALAEAFRTRGLPVVHAPIVHREDMADLRPNSLIGAVSRKGGRMKQGSPEAAYTPELEPHPTDYVVERTAGFIVFLGTSLDALLRRLDVQTVVLAGVSTNIAIPGNTIAAVELNYNVVIPEDCIAGTDPETHRVIVDEQLRMLARLTTAAELTAALG